MNFTLTTQNCLWQVLKQIWGTQTNAFSVYISPFWFWMYEEFMIQNVLIATFCKYFKCFIYLEWYIYHSFFLIHCWEKYWKPLRVQHKILLEKEPNEVIKALDGVTTMWDAYSLSEHLPTALEFLALVMNGNTKACFIWWTFCAWARHSLIIGYGQ